MGTVISGVVDAAISPVSGRHLAVDTSGNWWALFAYSATQIGVYKSADAGQTWSQSTLLLSGPANNVQGASIVALANGNVVVAFGGGNNLTYQALNTAVWNGSTWTQHINIESNFDAYATALVQDGTGKIWLFFEGHQFGASPANHAIYLSTSTDNGSTWSAQQLLSASALSNPSSNPAAATDSNNNVHLFWIDSTGTPVITYRKWTAASSSWGGTSSIGSAATPTDAVSCAVDASNRIFAVFAGTDAANASNAQIQYSKSTDGGTSWSAAARIQTVTGFTQDKPTLGIDNSGGLQVFWVGTDSINTTRKFLKYSTSANQGGTWSAWVNKATPAGSNQDVNTAIARAQAGTGMPYLYEEGASGSNTLIAALLTFNAAPNAPTLTHQGTFPAGSVQRFFWTFSDPNAGDTQGSFELVITRVSDGATMLDTGQVNSPNQFYDLAASTLANGVAYQWKVRTWDQSAAVGPYSSLDSFTTGVAPTATITSPAVDGATVTGSPITVAWSYASSSGLAQSKYQVRLLTGGVQQYSSGQISDAAARSYTIPFALISGTTYQIGVTVWDTTPTASSEALRTFVTSIAPPPAPTLQVDPDTNFGVTWVSADWPDPTGSQATPNSVDIYRRVQVAAGQPVNPWTRIIAAVPQDSGTTFTRASTTYDANGASLASGVARYDPGLFGGLAIKVERNVTNLVTNPSFETDTSGWGIANAATIARSTVQHWAGVASVLVTAPSTGAITGPTPAASANTWYTLSAWVFRTETAADIQIWAQRQDFGVAWGFVSAAHVLGWQRISCTFQTDGSTTGIRPVVQNASSTGTITYYVDAVQLEAHGHATTYADTTRAVGYVQTPLTAAFLALTTWTVELWAKSDYDTDAAGVDLRGLFGIWPGTFFVAVRWDGKPQISWKDQSAVQHDVVAAAAVTNVAAWHHYAFTWNGFNALFYVDGVLVISTTTPAIAALSGNLEVGSFGQANEWDGLIGVARFSKVVRTQAQLLANALLGVSLPWDGNTLTLHRFEGTVRYDVAAADYTAQHRAVYEYLARAVAGATTDSALAVATLLLDRLWLHDAESPATTLRGYLYDDADRTETRTADMALVAVAGRVAPIAEFSPRQQNTASSNFKMLYNSGDVEALRALYDSHPIVCYRDRRGRKIFGPMGPLSISDELGAFRTTVTVHGVDWSEAI